MKWWTGDLATLTGRDGQRAALVLLVVHLLVAVPPWLLWAVGLLPAFSENHWVLAVISGVYALIALFVTYRRFGVWAVGPTLASQKGSGEEYLRTFEHSTGFALGWFRWLMQMVLAALLFFAFWMTAGNVRWWHVTGTEELDALPRLNAAMPVPDSWTLERSEETQTGFPHFLKLGELGPDPQGFTDRTFSVPSSYTFDDLEQWLESPDWVGTGSDEAFGAIQRENCHTERATCDFHLVPLSGQRPHYFLEADFRQPSYDGAQPEVQVSLDYLP